MVDNRVWFPDETCEPFQFETGVLAADLLMGRFTVPVNRLAVITSVFTQTNSVQKKSTQHIAICNGRGDPAIDVSPRKIQMNGSLMNVEEMDTTGVGITGVVTRGFIAPAGAAVRPCRIILYPGDYEVVKVGTNGVCAFVIHGYVFPEHGR